MYLDIYVNYLLLVILYWNLNFYDRVWRKFQMSNFMKIRLMGAELCHADGGMAMTKLIIAFRNFANATKNWRQNIWARTKGICVFWMHYAWEVSNVLFLGLTRRSVWPQIELNVCTRCSLYKEQAWLGIWLYSKIFLSTYCALVESSAGLRKSLNPSAWMLQIRTRVTDSHGVWY